MNGFPPQQNKLNYGRWVGGIIVVVKVARRQAAGDPAAYTDFVRPPRGIECLNRNVVRDVDFSDSWSFLRYPG